MINIKKSVYRSSRVDDVVALEPFDYIIVTYQYDPPSGSDYDLDTLSAFRYATSTLTGIGSDSTQGMIPTLQAVGCGTNNYYSGSVVPFGSTIGTSYMAYGGDDVGQNQAGAFGESIVINFKNLKDANITTSNDIVVELFAGWNSGPSGTYPITVKYETFTGGTVSQEIVGGVTTNRFVSTGTSVSAPQISGPITVEQVGCSAGVNYKTKVASISYNLLTKVSSVTFY